MKKSRVILGVALGLAAVPVITVPILSLVGGRRFRRAYAAEKEQLERAARGSELTPFDPTAVERLPAPVQKYLSVTGALGKPRIRLAVLEQTGALRPAPNKPWMPFEAEQIYSMSPPGFLWLAEARIARVIKLWARDKFVDGGGNMLVRLLGAIPVADASGAAIDQGAALRFWGEITCFPEMALDPHLAWQPIDERQAKLVVDHGALKLEATVEFDEVGYPVAIHAERYRDVGGTQVLTRWSGRSLDWQAYGDRMFPSRWEAIWHLDDGDFLAVKMEVRSVKTELELTDAPN